jgi:hypothetical protein
VQDILNSTYHFQWIGRGGPTAWPSRSPALNPVSTPKPLVYAAPVDSEEALHYRIVDACQTTRSYTGVFVMTLLPTRRAEACVVSHGGHFEQLL